MESSILGLVVLIKNQELGQSEIYDSFVHISITLDLVFVIHAALHEKYFRVCLGVLLVLMLLLRLFVFSGIITLCVSVLCRIF